MMLRSSARFFAVFALAAAFVLGGTGFCGSAHAQSAFNDPNVAGPDGGTGGLVPVEPKVDAGTIDPGTSNSMIVQFRNESGSAIEFKDVKLFPSSNVTAQTMSDQCSSEPLETGAVCAIVMDVKGLQAGAFRVEVLARHSGRSRLVTATISGTVQASDNDSVKSSDVEITPAVVDFGKLEASRPIIRSVTLRNITSSEITVNDLFIDAPESSGFSLKTDCKTLAAGASCIASIVWSPVTKGPTSGALVVQHSGATGVATASITGEFNPSETEVAKRFPEPVPGKGLLVASEEEINFKDDIETQSSITVSLINIGDAPLTLTKVELSGSEQGLKLMPDGCTEKMELEPTEACPLTVTWTPSKSGSVIDDVKIAHTGARGVLILPVRGTSVAAVNQDSKPIVSVVESLPAQENGGSSNRVSVPSQPVEDQGPPVLDGYSITSMAKHNAIITGPGGSRMVRDGQQVRLAGRIWSVSVTEEGVSMVNGKNRVLLLFDRSLSKPGTTSSSSSSGSGSSGTSSTPSSTSTSSTPSSTGATTGTK